MPYCIHCGSQNPDAAKFCSNCGKAIATPVVQEQQPQKVQAPAELIQLQTETIPAPVQKPSLTSNADQTPQVEKVPLPQPVINENFRRPAIWGAILVIIGFFLPWENAYSLSGLGIIRELDSLAYSVTGNDSAARFAKTILSILICSVPLSALLFLTLSLSSPRISVLAKILRFLPFISLSIYLLMGAISGANVSVFALAIGLIITYLGAACMLFLKKEV